MLKPITTTQFERDYQKMTKRGKNIQKIKIIMDILVKEEKLEMKNKDHPLKGDYKNRRECHIEPDWLLVYKLNKKDKEIIFERTGTHSDLFK